MLLPAPPKGSVQSNGHPAARLFRTSVLIQAMGDHPVSPTAIIALCERKNYMAADEIDVFHMPELSRDGKSVMIRFFQTEGADAARTAAQHFFAEASREWRFLEVPFKVAKDIQSKLIRAARS